MRISMVSEHASPLAPPGSVDSGGQNVHVAALSRALADLGHTVTVYTRRDDAALPTRVALCKGVDVVHLTAGPPRRIPKDELLPYMGVLAEELAASWRYDPPDVVHSHFWMSGIAALEGARLLPEHQRPAVAHTFHALGAVKRRHQGASDTSPAERADLEPRVGQQADAVIATCDDEVDELRALGVPSHRIEIAPCGVDPDEFDTVGTAERRGSRHRLLSVGRIVPRKGMDLAIRALPLLRELGFDDVELEIVGSGDVVDGRDAEVDRLGELARELGVADRVHLRGQVGRDRMPALLRSADAVICTPWYEPFGIVPLESMACGTPVIAAEVGGLRDSVIDGITGLHVPPHDALAIAEAAARMLGDEPFRRALGTAGRGRVEARYTWAGVARQTESIYQRLLARERQQPGQLLEMAQ
ncbi:glycosyl transferase [Leucobacter sp. UCD-THU]|uniref:glycosyltransferase n=1 Tax=Leucobacter sp. UCD-THU TaxID=1292023 RepID=UPI00045F6B0F|nr:glycosyltransferase [Leucobacter sp. UCD-THU]EYT56339.1 glycosyl transferase [Leucobacter sp. UCD-THU]